MQALTPEQVESYRYNGFLSAFRPSRAPEVATCLAGLDRFEERNWHHPSPMRTSNGARTPMPTPPGSTRWSAIRAILGLARSRPVIGPNILVWTSTFFIKEPGSPTFAAWHQDGTYFGLDPHEEVCAQVALTDASREAGCMEMLSSRGAPRQMRHAALGLANSINRAGQTITSEPLDEQNPVAMALPAGSFSLHHEFAVHRSAPNNASHRRVGIGLNYIPTHAGVNGPVRLRAMLVRGVDTHGHFDPVEPPSVERDAAALAVHQQVSDRYRENYREQVKRHERMFPMANA